MSEGLYRLFERNKTVYVCRLKTAQMKQLRFLLVLLMFPLSGFAWRADGHFTCGAIAYYYLKTNKPEVLPKIIDVLEHHPWYTTPRWSEKLAGLTGEQKNVALFMLASTYPDDARSNPELGGGIKTKWHYVDYPFVPEGQNITGRQPESPNAEEKINELLGSLKNETDLAQKAVDLCWLFHLIEDVHQPLHSVSLYDSNHPDGDKGGNTTFILFPTSTKPVGLHGYWDDLVKGTFDNVPENARELLNKPMYKESNLTQLTTGKTVHDWIVNESFVIAKRDVYQNGKVNGTKDNPTQVDVSYGDNAVKIGERRVVLGGIRLAKKLELIFS